MPIDEMSVSSSRRHWHGGNYSPGTSRGRSITFSLNEGQTPAQVGVIPQELVDTLEAGVPPDAKGYPDDTVISTLIPSGGSCDHQPAESNDDHQFRPGG